MTQAELFDCRLPDEKTLSYRLLMALKSGERLTPLLALEKFNCLSLSQRLGELKRMGWPIQSRLVTVPSGKKVAEYSLL